MSLQERYKKEIVPHLKEVLHERNALSVPRLVKAVIHVGTGRSLQDAKFNELVEQTLQRITGQKPIATKARKSISNFKIRQGLVIGYKVTLRGKRMYDFVDRMIHVAIPRIRDFRGLSPRSVDPRGNCTIGFKEHLVFPEIRSDEVEKIHGLEVTLITTAKTAERGLALLKDMGFPFRLDHG